MTGQTIILDNHGDMSVQLKGDLLGATTYTVCSRALARASPVLRAQIRQYRAANTPEHQGAQNLVIQIHGNNDDSLAIFLNIAHAHFLAIPRTLTIHQLYNLVMLTSSYNCTSILAPWIDSWISTVQDTVRKGDIAMMFWVFWELDFQDDLRKMAHRMVVELDASEIENDSHLERNSKKRAVLDRLSQIRSQSLQALFATTSDMLEKLLAMEESPKWSRFAVRAGPSRCRQATCARIKSLLQVAGLWPLPQVADVRESVAEVYSKLAVVMSHNHMGCEFGRFWCRQIQVALNSELDSVRGLYEAYADVSGTFS